MALLLSGVVGWVFWSVVVMLLLSAAMALLL
jgi:hypothetical protein